jgi:hypothetical protein
MTLFSELSSVSVRSFSSHPAFPYISLSLAIEWDHASFKDEFQFSRSFIPWLIVRALNSGSSEGLLHVVFGDQGSQEFKFYPDNRLSGILDICCHGDYFSLFPCYATELCRLILTLCSSHVSASGTLSFIERFDAELFFASLSELLQSKQFLLWKHGSELQVLQYWQLVTCVSSVLSLQLQWDKRPKTQASGQVTFSSSLLFRQNNLPSCVQAFIEIAVESLNFMIQGRSDAILNSLSRLSNSASPQSLPSASGLSALTLQLSDSISKLSSLITLSFLEVESPLEEHLMMFLRLIVQLSRLSKKSKYHQVTGVVVESILPAISKVSEACHNSADKLFKAQKSLGIIDDCPVIDALSSICSLYFPSSQRYHVFSSFSSLLKIAGFLEKARYLNIYAALTTTPSLTSFLSVI